MILTVAVFLSTLGFVAWIVGTLFDYHGVAFIGATLVLGVGAMITVGGLEHQSGEIQTDTTSNETEVTYQYQEVDTMATFPLGFLVMLLGGSGALQTLGRIGG